MSFDSVSIATCESVLTEKDLIRYCEDSIAQGSKTFSFASRFFSKSEAQGASLLYAWCRYCDDQIDDAEIDQQVVRMNELQKLTELALRSDEPVPMPFLALRWVVRRFEIPHTYPFELLQGFRMDVENRRYETIEDLKVYCYRVAGVVGLMMAHIMGVNEISALRAACDLGLAMQLTNCARDVKADWQMGRVYLPMRDLERAGFSRDRIFSKRDGLWRKPQGVHEVVKELLCEADRLYQSGERGVIHLPAKSSLVILIARFSYARIGTEVLKRGAGAWEDRVVTTRLQKVGCLLNAVFVWIRCWPQRKKFVRVSDLPVWRIQ